jgi:hypothetical protein
MDPPSIVKRCVAAGLHAVGVVDHNSAQNARSVVDAARGTGLLVIPGIEAQSSEEIHLVLLFEHYQAALAFEAEVVRPALPRVRCRRDVFGRQYKFDAAGRVVGEEETLLLNSLELDAAEILSRAGEYAAVRIAAHADRPMNGYLYTLGILPSGPVPDCFEFSGVHAAQSAIRRWQLQGRARVIISSDAHSLSQIVPGRTALHLDRLDFAGVSRAITSGSGERVVMLQDTLH